MNFNVFEYYNHVIFDFNTKKKTEKKLIFLKKHGR